MQTTPRFKGDISAAAATADADVQYVYAIGSRDSMLHFYRVNLTDGRIHYRGYLTNTDGYLTSVKKSLYIRRHTLCSKPR